MAGREQRQEVKIQHEEIAFTIKEEGVKGTWNCHPDLSTLHLLMNNFKQVVIY